MINQDTQRWCEATGCRVLRNLGLAEGNVVADLGCREGRYVIPAARVVGRTGRIYAIDRDVEALKRLEQRAAVCGLTNIRIVCADFLRGPLALAPSSVDLALLFDILHGAFFSEPRQRIDLLQHVRQVLKPRGLLAIYPTHSARHGPPRGQLEAEIHQAGFREIDRSRRHLLHDDRLVRGWVLVYKTRRLQRSSTEHAAHETW